MPAMNRSPFSTGRLATSSRRAFLQHSAAGLGTIALSTLLRADPRGTHFAAKAKRWIGSWMLWGRRPRPRGTGGAAAALRDGCKSTVCCFVAVQQVVVGD